ncbi:MAG: DNA polymerase III subunit delta' [Anaerolineaceae bacterium]
MTWNICGHESAVAFLKEHTKPEKLRHAYLITGPQGVGRRTLALAFIKALNCLNPPAQGEFCNQCLVCRQINAQTFSDLTVLAPIEGHKDLKIDQIRTMQQSLALAPYQAKYRVILILDFQRATAAASNALLKSLEEPPARAILVLTADAQESLLETIASRCEILRLRPLPVENAEHCLVEQYGLPEERARLLAHLTSGRMGAAVRFDQDPDLISTYQDALEKLEELLPAKKRQRLQYVETQLKQKSSLRELVYELVSAWLTFWRDVLIARSEAGIPLVNQDKAALIQHVASQVPLGEVESLLKAHEKALDQLDKYVNPRLVIENLLISLPSVKI